MIPDESKSVIQEIHDPILDKKHVRVLIKRDDLIHSEISGNKWRKLKYNIDAARKEGHHTLLTFGGAFSNHVLAVASSGKEFKLKTIGVIRGEVNYSDNPTLSHCKAMGMKLHFVSREQYKFKNEAAFIDELKSKFGEFFIIPEGGTNCLAMKGCQELAESIEIPFDIFCCSVGTGGTLSGILSSKLPIKNAIGFSALKGDFLKREVQDILKRCNQEVSSNWDINTHYHFGGYAKFDDSLVGFINKFYTSYGIPLDPIYTGKMLFGIFDLINKDYFQTGTTILALHSGGLQGNRGFNILHDQAIVFE